MSDDLSPRQRRRQQKLVQLLVEVGGPTQAALDTGTQRSHFSAMKAGTRGLGDDLAAKLERIYKKPEGWFDQPDDAWPFSDELREAVAQMDADGLRKLEDAIWTLLALTVGTVTEVKKPERLSYPDDAQEPTNAPLAPKTGTLLERARVGGTNARSKSGGVQMPRSGGGSKRAA